MSAGLFETLPSQIYIHYFQAFLSQEEYRFLLSVCQSPFFAEIKKNTAYRTLSLVGLKGFCTDDAFRRRFLQQIGDPSKQLSVRMKCSGWIQQAQRQKTWANYQSLEPILFQVHSFRLEWIPGVDWFDLSKLKVPCHLHLENLGSFPFFSFQEMKNLETLYLSNWDSLVTTETMEGLIHLKSVTIESCQFLRDINHLAHVPTLIIRGSPSLYFDGIERLGVNNQFVTFSCLSINDVSHLKSVKELTLVCCGLVESVHHLPLLTTLEVIDCNGLSKYHQLPSLTKLTTDTGGVTVDQEIRGNLRRFHSHQLTPQHLPRLLQFSSLQCLRLENSNWKYDITPFHAHLRQLSLVRCPWVTFDIDRFQLLTHLQLIESHTFLHIRVPLPQLKVIWIVDCPMMHYHQGWLSELPSDLRVHMHCSSGLLNQVPAQAVLGPSVAARAKVFSFDKLEPVMNYRDPVRLDWPTIHDSSHRHRDQSFYFREIAPFRVDEFTRSFPIKSMQLLVLSGMKSFQNLNAFVAAGCGFESIPVLVLENCPRLVSLYKKDVVASHSLVILAHCAEFKHLTGLAAVTRISILNCRKIDDFTPLLPPKKKKVAAGSKQKKSESSPFGEDIILCHNTSFLRPILSQLLLRLLISSISRMGMIMREKYCELTSIAMTI